MLPDIPQGWQSALAAVGAILVVVLLLRWTADVLKGQGQQSENLIGRSFDIADRAMAGEVRARGEAAAEAGAEEPAAMPETVVTVETTPPPEGE